MDLLVYITFDHPECSRDKGVFEVSGIEMSPEIYTTEDFEYALGVYEHPEAFETFLNLYNPLDLVQLQFYYFDISDDAPEQNYLTHEDLAALSRHSVPKPSEPKIVYIDLAKIYAPNHPNAYYFKVTGLYRNTTENKKNVPDLYNNHYGSLKEVLIAVNQAVGNPVPMVELVINNFTAHNPNN